jgi:hypothetical protein
MSAPIRIDELTTASVVSVGAYMAVVTGGLTKNIQLSDYPFIQSGTGAVAEIVQSALRGRISISSFLTTAQIADVQAGTLTLDTHDAIMNASAQAVLTGRGLDFIKGKYLASSAFAFTTAHNYLKWFGIGYGGAVIYKGFSGDLGTITATVGLEFNQMHFHGQHGTFTGKGFIFSGASNYPSMPGTVFEGFTDTHIEFGADSGYDFEAPGARFLLTGAQTNPRCIHVNGPDTGAPHRSFIGCKLDGYYDLDGSFGIDIIGGRFNTIESDTDCTVSRVAGATWAASSAITISGSNWTVTGCRIANSVTLAASSSGAFVGNHPTSGTITNSASAGSWTIFHREGGSNVYKIGQHVLDSVSAVSAPGCIPSHRTQFPGDAGLAWVYGTHGDHVIYQVPIGADRTVTFATSAPVPPTGAVVRVSRQAAATGAFNVIVGPGGITLGIGEWIDHVWDSSAWQATSGGTIPT